LKPGTFSVADSTPPVLRARVFRNQDGNAVIVLYTGNMQPVELTTTLDVLRVESVTGEILSNSPLVVTNGLIYLYAKVPEDLIDADTPAMAMLKGSKKPRVTPKVVAPPFVTVFDYGQLEANSAGYRIKLDVGMDLRIPLTIYDLSRNLERAVTISGMSSAGVITQEMYAVLNIRPSQEDHIAYSMSVEFLEEFNSDDNTADVQKIASDSFCETVTIRFLFEPTYEALLEKHKNNVPLDIAPENWVPSSSGTLSINAAENPGENGGVILRGRATGETTPRFFLHERDSGAGYMTEASLFPADGEWHAVRIPFDRLIHCGATPPDPNGRLDLDQVNTLSIGFNTQSREATLEIGDCVLIRR